MADEVAKDAAHEEQIKRIMKRVEEKLRKDLKSGVRPLHEIEQEVEDIGETVKREIIKEATQDLGAGYVGTRITCTCGARAKYANSSRRQLVTIHGELGIVRAYYHCRSCRKGFCPLDQALGLGSGECTRSVQSLLARFTSHMSFALAAEELEIVCGIRLSATTMQTYSKRIGQVLAQKWERHLREVQARIYPTSGERVKRLYCSMDGVMVHIGGEWREVKLAATYQRSVGGRAWKTNYYASIEKSHIFGPKMRCLADMTGADRCSDIVMLGDGAPWIWQETGKYFPRSVQILDYYHLTEHLAVIASDRFGAETAAAREWLKCQKQRLLSDQVDLVSQDIREWKPRKKAKVDARRKALDYLTEHRHRVAYGTLREHGYHIGSGVIEAGAKSVVKARMTASGMRWEEPGATAMLHVSTHWKSAGSDGFFPYTAAA
jgi:hypothetical protein